MKSNDSDSSQGGYDWSAGMSRRAVAAYDSGLLPASKLAAALRADGYAVDAAFIRSHFTADEWHHTSSKYNRTDFYDLTRIAAEIAASPDLQSAIAAHRMQRLARAADIKSGISYQADVTFTEFTRIVLNRFGKLGGWRPVFRTVKSVTVREVSDQFIEITGEGRVKRTSKVAITKLDSATIRARKNLATAAKRKATIARRKIEAAAGRAMQTALAQHRSPRPLALPAPARSEPWHTRRIDDIRAELGRGYAFDSLERGVIYGLAHRVAFQKLTMDAARAEVATLARTWAFGIEVAA